MLIHIRLPHKQLHPLHTPSIHPKYLRNTRVHKQIPFTLNTPPLRTDPHIETHWVCFYGGPGCGVGWRVRGRQPALRALFLGSVKARGGRRDAMQPFSTALTAAVCFLSC